VAEVERPSVHARLPVHDTVVLREDGGRGDLQWTVQVGVVLECCDSLALVGAETSSAAGEARSALGRGAERDQAIDEVGSVARGLASDDPTERPADQTSRPPTCVGDQLFEPGLETSDGVLDVTPVPSEAPLDAVVAERTQIPAQWCQRSGSREPTGDVDDELAVATRCVAE